MYAALRSTIASAALLASYSTAMTMSVRVGSSLGNFFDPQTISANIGDIIEFDFSSTSLHSVAQGSAEAPCSPSEGGFFSGSKQGKTTGYDKFSITIIDTNPVYFYCTVFEHCVDGMVGIINPVSAKDEVGLISVARAALSVGVPSATGTDIATSARIAASTAVTSMGPMQTDSMMSSTVDMDMVTSSTDTMGMNMSTPTGKATQRTSSMAMTMTSSGPATATPTSGCKGEPKVMWRQMISAVIVVAAIAGLTL